MAKIFDVILLVVGGAALWYAYKKGYLDDIFDKLGGIGNGNGGAAPAEEYKEPSGGGSTTKIPSGCKFVSAPMTSDPKRFRINDENGKEAGGGKYYNSKAEADAVIAQMCAPDANEGKTGGTTTKKRSNLALAYLGSHYDGAVLDTAYFVTTPSSFIPRRHENTIAMGVSIA